MANKIRIEIASGSDAVLKRQDIKEIVKNAVGDGIDTVKLIGKDPLEHHDIINIVKDIAAIEGVAEVSMTTNGRLLGEKAKTLKEAGLARVNINLDTLQHYKYVGGSLEDVIAGINAATDAGLKPVRLNVTLQKEYNDDEVLDFVQLTFQHDYEVRFIEMSDEEEAASRYAFVACEDIKKKLPVLRSAVAAADGEPAENPRVGNMDVYKYPGARGKICFISKRAEDFEERSKAVIVKVDGTVIK